jgi:flavin-dependent dehydrogenase
MQHDIIILGGGLSGLTLSLQLKQRFPDLDILVLERRNHPVPAAAHKIGESSVEIGAHYFANVLGLKDYLQKHQLKKFGFRFFFSDGERDLTKVTELGASTFLSTPAYQLDRGLFENALGGFARERGVKFIDGAMVRKFELSDGATPHQVSYDRAGVTHRVTSRWLLDASGRAGMIKRHLDLAESNEHDANAVWFRIAERIDINDWSDDRDWLARCNPPNRWLSTNHLMGEGYWAWLIPLASGSHSVGIVADAALHPIETLNTFEKSMAWLRVHQPRLYEALDSKRDKLQDFAFFKRFSYGCKRVFSGEQRWALTGEAGFFLDPFYSPGSDFIAIANTFITELVAQDRADGPVEMYANIYEQIHFSLYQNMLPLYIGQYKLFGDPEVMPMKVIWDYTFYWGVMCQLFFQNRLTDVVAMGRMQKTLGNVQQLNIAMQEFLLAWHKVSKQRNLPRMLDQSRLDWFAELNRGLTDSLDGDGFTRRMNDMLAQLDQLAAEIVTRATSAYPMLDGSKVLALVNAKMETPTTSMLFEKAA